MEASISTENYIPPSQKGRYALYAGGIAAVLASTCHHISYLLATLSLSKTKILYIVTLADWSRPFLVFVALIALCISYRHIWRVSSIYDADINRTISRSKITDKVFFSFIVMLVIFVLMLPYFAPCVE